jgi:hypothetical protein
MHNGGMSDAARALPSPRVFFGWRVVAAAFVLASFGWGVGFYGPPVYLHEVQATRGWPVLLVSAAVTVHFLVGAIVVANLPALYRRHGLPRITKAGCASLALGVLGWATAAEPWQLLVATVLSGAGWVAMGAAAVNAIIAPWFARTRPAALAMAYNGASIGGVVFSPLWVAAIGLLGFPWAAAIIGLVMIAAVWLLADHIFSRTPEKMGLRPDGDAAGAPAVAAALSPHARPLPGAALWRDRSFLTLAAGMALGLVAQVGLIAHLFSLLVPALGGQGAGLAMGAATACAIAGRTLVGWLMPAGADRRRIACASYAVQFAGAVLLIIAAGESVPLLLTGVALFGAGIGNATSLPPLIAQVEFVKDDVPRVVPLIVAIGQGSYAFAPAAFGAIRALADGEAPLVFIAAAAIQLLAIGCFLAGRRC